MTDIDFEELDRAVNSLMEKATAPKAPVAAAQPAEGEPAVQTTDTASVPVSSGGQVPGSSITDGTAPSSAPSPEPSSSDEPAFESTTEHAAPTIIKRPAGRFMDVVHPSSDMTHARSASSLHSSEDVPSSSGLQQRIAQSLQDSQQAVVASPSTDTVQVATDGLEAQPATEAAAAVNVMQPAIAAEPSPALAEEPLAPVEEATPVDSATEVAEPPMSPFVEGAVVEKRPLGEPVIMPLTPEPASAAAESVSDWSAAPEPAADSWSAERQADVAQTTPPVAPELAPELMALESTPTDAGGSSDAPSVFPQSTVSVVDQPAPMYNVETQAQSLEHVEKRPSGWLSVLLILLCILIGAGGGAAAYFFLLQ